jgi:glycerol-3-phosphate acyltransferase PlsX
MHDIPSVAIRQKRNSSIALLIEALKKKEIDAVVSAGNTGAIMGFSMFVLGKITDTVKAGLAVTLPTEIGYSIMLDVGANINPKIQDFCNYGIMGSVLAEIILGKESPRVALLNIGGESIKGDDSRQKAYAALEGTSINFIGNVEGNDIMKGFADVIICDGFTGNVILKFSEGLIDTLTQMLKKTVYAALRRRFGQFLVKPAFESLKSKFNYEEYGGAILLGVDGIVIVCHGRSSPEALSSAIKLAKTCVEQAFVDEIRKRLTQ